MYAHAVRAPSKRLAASHSVIEPRSTCLPPLPARIWKLQTRGSDGSLRHAHEDEIIIETAGVQFQRNIYTALFTRMYTGREYRYKQ